MACMFFFSATPRHLFRSFWCFNKIPTWQRYWRPTRQSPLCWRKRLEVLLTIDQLDVESVHSASSTSAWSIYHHLWWTSSHLYDNTSKDTGPGRPGEAEVHLQDDHLGRMWIITISTTTLNCLWYGHGAPLVDADPLGEYDARDKKSAYAFPELLWPWTQAGSKSWS